MFSVQFSEPIEWLGFNWILTSFSASWTSGNNWTNHLCSPRKHCFTMSMLLNGVFFGATFKIYRIMAFFIAFTSPAWARSSPCAHILTFFPWFNFTVGISTDFECKSTAQITNHSNTNKNSASMTVQNVFSFGAGLTNGFLLFQTILFVDIQWERVFIEAHIEKFNSKKRFFCAEKPEKGKTWTISNEFKSKQWSTIYWCPALWRNVAICELNWAMCVVEMQWKFYTET